MCGRYALHAHPDVVALQFAVDSVPEFKPRYNIAPMAEILVVKESGAAIARWGLRGRFTNLRAETVADKFRAAYRRGRCLVPASGFYEWRREGATRQPYYFRPARDPLLGFAGLWEGDTCTLITTAATAAVRRIHERMPLILTREQYAGWLDGDEGLLERVPQAAIVAHPVSTAVNQAANDSPELIEPAALRTRSLFD